MLLIRSYEEGKEKTGIRKCWMLKVIKERNVLDYRVHKNKEIGSSHSHLISSCINHVLDNFQPVSINAKAH